MCIKLWIHGDWNLPDNSAVESAPEMDANQQLACSHVGLKAKRVSWHKH